jgi:Schlafen, AlbA_2
VTLSEAHGPFAEAVQLWDEICALGFARLERLREDQARESEVLEFKEKARGDQPSLDPEVDSPNIARTVCAFANSDGGVLLLGVRAHRRTDTVEKLIPFVRPDLVAGSVEDLLDICSDPRIPDVRVIPILDDLGSGRGCVAVLVPPARGVGESGIIEPAMCMIRGKDDDRRSIKNSYLIRENCRSRCASHRQVLALFRRRPRPRLSIRSADSALGRELAHKLKGNSDAVPPLSIELSNEGLWPSEDTRVTVISSGGDKFYPWSHAGQRSDPTTWIEAHTPVPSAEMQAVNR